MYYLVVVMILATTSVVSSGFLSHIVNRITIKSDETAKQLAESREKLKSLENHVELRLVHKSWLPDAMEPFKGKGALDKCPVDPGEAEYVMDRFHSKYEYETRSLVKGIELFIDGKAEYNKEMDTIIIINPPSVDTDNFVQGTVKAFALRNMIMNYNIFTLDFLAICYAMDSIVRWSALGSRARFNEIGQSIGSIFLTAIKQGLLKPEQINIIGYCYSSHLAGYIGRYITKNGGGKVQSILGLDPFSVGLAPLFRTPLSATDAEVVNIYHSNSAGLGTYYRRGTADFVFNGGDSQPGCEDSSNFWCNHDRVMMYAWYVILFKQRFQARSCSNHWFFNGCMCQNNNIEELSYPPDKNVKGNFYLRTKAHAPYGGFVRSADCKREAVKKVQAAKAARLTEWAEKNENSGKE